MKKGRFKSSFTFVLFPGCSHGLGQIETDLKCIGGNVEHQDVISPSGLQVCVFTPVHLQ